MSRIEFIVTLRYQECGDIISLDVPLGFDEAAAAIQKFKDAHDHNNHINPGPWVV